MITIPAQKRIALYSTKLQIVVLLILAGDFLFFGRSPGFNLAVFATLLCGGIIWSNKAGKRSNQILVSSLLIAGIAILALAENTSWISIFLGLVGVSTLVLDLEQPWYRNASKWLAAVGRFVFSAPARMLNDVTLVRKLKSRYRSASASGRFLTWLVPIVLSSVFMILFASANPVFEDFLNSIFQMPESSFIPAGRFILWLTVALLVWPFFTRRKTLREKPTTVIATDESQSGSLYSVLFSRQSIVRSLILFNLLFALQTSFDLAYLWAGAKLPDGMSYASYAHRGAYPLLVTVLLAAGFVLVTMYKGAPTEHDKFIRGLVFVWVGQNILLTFSSIERLWLYVSAYSLTYLRVAAFIWMALIALGLALIIFRLWHNYPNRWLVDANFLSLTITLTCCAFVNFGSEIAWFNVKQSREVTGNARLVDVRYLYQIGPQALPAATWMLQNLTNPTTTYIKPALKRHMSDWEDQIELSSFYRNNLTLRDRRLVNWLANHRATMQKKTAASKRQEKR